MDISNALAEKPSPHLVFHVFLSGLETVIAIVLLGVYNYHNQGIVVSNEI